MAETLAANQPPLLSFPAILRNPGLRDRFAHLHTTPTSSQDEARVRAKKLRRDENEGKRWVRRKDNARFVGNPHVVAASKTDYTPTVPSNKSTFPEPLPSYLPRNIKLPIATLPSRDPGSANAGRFSLSMKGMRRELRRAGARAEALVRDVETEIVDWLQGGILLRPSDSNATDLNTLQLNSIAGGRSVGSTAAIVEVSRTPLQLVWSIADDPFARYVVHCCARYHEIVSFSKGDSNERLTYLLRPNVRQPDYRATATLETPPITDLDYSSHPDTTTDIDSDFVSERELADSDLDERSQDPKAALTHSHDLSIIDESWSQPSSPLMSHMDAGEWSVINGDPAVDGDDSGSEISRDLGDSIASLSLEESQVLVHEIYPTQEKQRGAPDDQVDGDNTLSQEAIASSMQEILEEEIAEPRISYHHQPAFSNRRWIRNTSSPSRSPARTRRFVSAKKKRQAAKMRVGEWGNRGLFYDYLFA